MAAEPAPVKPGRRAAVPVEIDYVYGGLHDRVIFLAEVRRTITDATFADTTSDDLSSFLTRIENDAEMTDTRWAAYLLATVLWETRSTIATGRAIRDKQGKAQTGKDGNAMTRTVRKTRVMQPVEEGGHGAPRRYYQPVKLEHQAGGKILLTEHDGDQFMVSILGDATPVEKAVRGAPYLGEAAKSYEKSPGIEHSYFGRGYCQLTWWDGYLAAGKEIGVGTVLLLNPDLAENPDTAYKIASLGMRTGAMFANRHKFADYFAGAATDYAGARAMVNGTDHDDDIAAIARKFEAALLKSRPIAPRPAAVPPSTSAPVRRVP